jgi:SAM-dependent methyltransferase
MAQRKSLDQALLAYYTNPPQTYYEIAGRAIDLYTPELLPFHCDLVSKVFPGQRLLELGCGDAHLCLQIERKGAHYTGLDHSPQLLADNRRRYPNATFLPIDETLTGNFDVVASLYTIEHVVDPPAYLERMWNFCQPGGLLAVICPEFVDTKSLSPSFFYGHTPRRFRQKVSALAFGDAWAHLCDLKWNAMRWRKRARAASPGAFWINLQPRILHGADYSIDADAVHLPRLKDLIWWFEQRGAAIVETSQTMCGVNPDVLRHNCYILARKGAS